MWSLLFISVSIGLEFIYAQSPNNMKGLQTGMFYLIFGIFSAIGSTIYYNFPAFKDSYAHDTSDSLAAWFCFMLVVIGTIGFVVYTTVACCYKNRQRPTTDGSEHDTQRRLIYEDVFDSGTA